MNEEKEHYWPEDWFNKDYLKLYDYRNSQEAKKQVDFLVKALGLSGKERVLDLCCGAGRHSIEFAMRGFEVLGVDSSSDLIKEGWHQLEKLPELPVKFKVKDIRNLKNIGEFDLVISMFTSFFGYFADDLQNAELFDIARQHLPKDGQFFLDYLHPSKVKRDFKKFEERIVDGEKVIIQKAFLNDNIIVRTIKFPDKTYEERVKLYEREEIEEMIMQRRFCIEHIWNDFDWNPWRPDGDRQLFHCRAV